MKQSYYWLAGFRSTHEELRTVGSTGAGLIRLRIGGDARAGDILVVDPKTGELLPVMPVTARRCRTCVSIAMSIEGEHPGDARLCWLTARGG